MNTTPLKQTPLHAWHVARGAKMAPFAGFSMPIQYSGIRQEHEAVRTRAGLFDVSHMGNFFVTGPGALGFLQRLTTNDAGKLAVGDVQYSAICRDDGGLLDDILVYRFGDEDYMVVVNASNIAKDWNWFADHHKAWESDCVLENASDAVSIVSLQGPNAVAILRELAPDFDDAMKTYGCGMLEVDGVMMRVGRTGYTGEDGFEFYPAASETVALWDAIMEAGTPHGLLPVGLAARDTLRLESGYSLYGHELSEEINPLEAGLGWITALDREGSTKGDFVGGDSLRAIRSSGPARKLTGLVMDELAIPREGCAVRHEGRVVGVVTSGTLSPTLGKGIALALVEPAAAVRGTKLEVEIRGTPKPATASARTFYKRADKTPATGAQPGKAGAA